MEVKERRDETGDARAVGRMKEEGWPREDGRREGGGGGKEGEGKMEYPREKQPHCEQKIRGCS